MSLGWTKRGRFELKYAIPTSMCAQILEEASPWLRPDPHGEPLPEGGLGYRVHSLYYDTFRAGVFTLEDYRDRLAERDVRDRLRVRTYGQPGQGSAVFLENKRKQGERVVKARARICSAEQWHECSEPDPWMVLGEHLQGAQRAFLESFHRLIGGGRRVPVSVVHYHREVYLDRRPDHHDVRLTIDRSVCATLRPQSLSLYADPDVWLLPPDWCVLEMKFSGTRPGWMRELCARHRIRAVPISKFGLSVMLGFRSSSIDERRYFTPQPLRSAGRLATPEAVVHG